MINTLEYSQELIAVGFTPEQARVQANTLIKAIEKGSATKEDLAKLEGSLKEEIAEVKGDVKLLKWMAGFQFALMLAIFLKLFVG